MAGSLAGWFRRGPLEPAAADDTDEQPDDSPAAMLARRNDLVRFINSHAGRLPVEAVVVSLGITDTIGALIATAEDRALDIHAVISVDGIVGDYLPMTLRAYLSLDPDITERAGANGTTPRVALREQLDVLSRAADEVLRASRAHDADALFSQGNFLQTKFSGSDLDLKL